VKCIEDDIPFELPKGRAWERLSNLATFSGGKTPSTSRREYWDGEVLWVTSKDMKSKYITSSQLRLSVLGAEQMQIYQPDTLLLVTRSGILRHTLPIGILKECATVNQDLKAIVLYMPELAEYVYVCLKGMESQLLLKYTKSGTTVENVNFDEFQKVLLPIAPFQEIRKIIEATSEATIVVSSIEDEKAAMAEYIVKAKAKILDLAIRGQLVSQDPTDEPASVLLERIRAEKEELVQQGKIKRDKKESVIFRGEDNSYYLRTGELVESLEGWAFEDLPDSWSVCCLGDLCDYGNCTNVDTADIDDSAWMLDLEDIEKDSGVVLQKVRKAERNAASTKHRFHKGQVLYSKLRPYLNKVVLADEDGYCTSEILPLEFERNILPQYARYYLMSPAFLRYANKCSYGVKMPRLGTADGKKAIISIPPFEEQKRIVLAIELAFSQLVFISESLA
jgi:type I restriction enzyme S subunit